MSSSQSEVLVFSICGQEFRLRAEGDTADRMKKVAVSVEALVRERKSQGSGGELRAALMTAYELAYELSELKDELGRLKTSGASQAMDRLLARIEKEMRSLEVSEAGDEGAAAPAKEKPQGKKR